MSGNLIKWIERAANGEPIEACVIGHDGYLRDSYGDPLPDFCHKVLSWDEAKQHLTPDFHDGYGGAECPPVEVYTASRVIFVSEYDGATSTRYVPRNPTPGKPYYDGRMD